MRCWKIYSSGINYGKVYFDGTDVWHEKLDVFTGSYLEKAKLTTEENTEYRSLLRFDLLEFASHLNTLEAALKDYPEEIEAETGERYQKFDDHMYIQRDIKFPRNLVFADGKIVGVVCPSREMVNVLIDENHEDLTVISQWKEKIPDETVHPVEFLGEFGVVTRDKVTLATDVMLPKDRKTALSTVLVRTPYGKEDCRKLYYRFVQRGYAVVIQDVRGRNKSTGDWTPNYYEVEDGDDTLNWIAAQDWSNQKVGMIGGSYLGYVQWAAAASGNPYLKALVSVVCAGSSFIDIPRRGGCFVSGMMAWSFYVSKQIADPMLMMREDWDDVLDIRPLEDIPKKALGYEIPFLSKWLKHVDYDDFWHKSNWAARSVGAKIPALIQSGWFDDDGMGTTEALELTKDYPAGMRKVILGPWPHSGNAHYDLHGLALGKHALRFDIDLNYFLWFDHFLNGVENGVEKGSPVEYYTVTEDKWKVAETWPIPNTKQVEFYLDSDGQANTSSGNGRLLLENPSEEKSDTYEYDPNNPATCIIDMSENEIEVPGDYTEEEKRQDYLCYTTAPFQKDTVITGDFTVHLHVSSDAPDTDFMVRITDVDENGTSFKLADGVLSARYRNGFEHSEFMEPGKVYELVIRTTKLSNLFQKGHSMRFTVTSSAKNFIFPNSNTKDGYNSDTIRIAQNTVHHGGKYPSRVVASVEVE